MDTFGLDADVAMVVTSELATNAVRHAQTSFQVSVTVESDTVRIEVQDGAGAVRIASELATDREGHGLQLIDALATEWGVERRGPDKAVWVRLPHERLASQSDGNP